MVFYFTATGNSLYAARQLDKNTMSIPQVMRCKSLRRFADETIGVVYPIYGHRPPEMVQRFLREVTLDTPYLYIIPTYGARHANAVDIVSDICRASGKAPAYIHTLLMVDNYLPAFDMDGQRALDKHVDAQLAEIKADIAGRKRYIEPVTDNDRAAHANFLKYEAALPDRSLAGLVYATDRCIGVVDEQGGDFRALDPFGVVVRDAGDRPRQLDDPLAALRRIGDRAYAHRRAVAEAVVGGHVV